jgi:hypothetical protein
VVEGMSSSGQKREKCPKRSVYWGVYERVRELSVANNIDWSALSGVLYIMTSNDVIGAEITAVLCNM